MIPTRFSVARLFAGAASLALVGLSTGCSPTDKDVIAWVNKEPILATDYYPRVLAVSQIPQGFTSDAGALTLVNMIRDRLTDQLARAHNAVPSDDLVTRAVQYDIRMNPDTEEAMLLGHITQEGLIRQKRYEMEAFNIGTGGDSPSEQDVDKAYDEYKDKPYCVYPASYLAKIIQAPDDATARKIIADLKQTDDFKAAAIKYLNAPPITAGIAAKVHRLRVPQLAGEQYQPIKDALDRLKPNEVSPEPVVSKVPDPNQPLTTTFKYYIIQLKSKEPEQKLTKADIPFFLRPIALQKTHPAWKEHYARLLADYYKQVQSTIRISLPQYEGLPDEYIRPLVAGGAAQAQGAAAPSPAQ